MDEAQLSKLDSLPASSDKYWKDAEVELVELNKSHGCDHNFRHETAMEVSCKKCGIGYVLTPGWYVYDGHIYDKNDKFVI